MPVESPRSPGFHDLKNLTGNTPVDHISPQAAAHGLKRSSLNKIVGGKLHMTKNWTIDPEHSKFTQNWDGLIVFSLLCVVVAVVVVVLVMVVVVVVVVAATRTLVWEGVVTNARARVPFAAVRPLRAAARAPPPSADPRPQVHGDRHAVRGGVRRRAEARLDVLHEPGNERRAPRAI